MSETFITATAVGHAYGDRQILEGIDLTIHAGDRVALVGRNGSGKSTLLRLLAGLEAPATGRIDRLRGLRLAWLPQVAATAGERTVRQELAARTGVAAAERRMNRETELLAAGDTSRIEAQTEAVEAWSELGGPDLDARVGQALERTGIDPAWAERPLGSLSGGQLARINLATLHLARLDVALLDEPGNHLDAEGLAMLAGLATDVAPAVVLASHDRRLLDGFAETVFEIDRGRARLWRGGWRTYLREQEAADGQAEAEWAEAAAEKKRLVALERRISQQAKVGERRARRSGETDKHIRYAAIQSAQKNTAISGIAKRIEQMEVPEKPWREDLSRLLLDSGQPVHSPQVAMVKGAIAARGEWRSAPIDLALGRGERVLLSGPNGSGKSSLIAMLTGRLEPAAGSVEIPRSLRMVELAQQGSLFAAGSGSLAERFEALSGLDRTTSRTALAAMRIGPEQAGREPAELSPGELTRAELSLISRLGAACLLLDEPSNHLDIEALEVLEAALEGWPGALVVASHDEAFREAVRFDRTVELG